MPNNFDIDPKTGKDNLIGKIYFNVNYGLLSFFVVEICLKFFADGLAFVSEYINVFDSIVVLVSFYF